MFASSASLILETRTLHKHYNKFEIICKKNLDYRRGIVYYMCTLMMMSHLIERSLTLCLVNSLDGDLHHYLGFWKFLGALSIELLSSVASLV